MSGRVSFLISKVGDCVALEIIMGTEFSDGFTPVGRVAFLCSPRDQGGNFCRASIHRNGVRENTWGHQRMS